MRVCVCCRLLSWRPVAVFSCSPLWEFPYSATGAILANAEQRSHLDAAQNSPLQCSNPGFIGYWPRSIILRREMTLLFSESMNHAFPQMEIPCFHCHSSPHVKCFVQCHHWMHTRLNAFSPLFLSPFPRPLQALWMHLDVCNDCCGWHASVFWTPILWTQ